MQIGKVSNVQNQNSQIAKTNKTPVSFNDTLKIEKETSELVYDKWKIGETGEIYVLENNSWKNINANFEGTECGPNEIVVLGEDFVKIGVDIVKNFGISGLMNKTDFAVQEDLGFSDMFNGLALVPGKIVNLLDGTVLKWTRNGVDFTPRKTYSLNESAIAQREASELAFAMNQFTRLANNQALGVGKVIGVTKEKTQAISRVLTAMGIDISRDFYVNGKKFNFDTKSGEFKYTLEGSSDGSYRVRYVNAPKIRLALDGFVNEKGDIND